MGIQRRWRVITIPGQQCPEDGHLEDIRSSASPNSSVTTDNFITDFIRASDGKPRDLMLILDSSGSINKWSFKAMKEGVQMLIDSLCGGFGPNATQNRLSIIQFSTEVKVKMTFTDDQSPESIRNVIEQLDWMQGYTFTGEALMMAYDYFDKEYTRPYAVQDTLIITDGDANGFVPVANASLKLQERSNVYALAIGMFRNDKIVDEFTSLVSSGNPRHLFSLANFQEFLNMTGTVEAKLPEDQCQPIVLPPPSQNGTNS